MATTLYEKLYNRHVIREFGLESPIIYVDRHLVHEVTSPQAFSGIRQSEQRVRCPQRTFATMDHNVSTKSRDWGATGEISRKQMETLAQNCQEHQIKLFDLDSKDQGIIHVIAPEMGITLPGMVIVCGDSHTATHGAFGSLAFGIGTSEVEHVLATQTLWQSRSKTMAIHVEGDLQPGVFAKDLVLSIIRQIGTDGATGFVIEYRGPTISHLSMEERMTLCNMSIEAGAKSGMIAPDQKTFAYLHGKDYAPTGETWEKAVQDWQTLKSDKQAAFDKIITVQANQIAPQVTWGTNPGQTVGIGEKIPSPTQIADPSERTSLEAALAYQGIAPGTRMPDVAIDKVFIGSCTNGRIEDLRVAAAILNQRKIHSRVTAIVVPGSGRVFRQAVAEGLDKIFTDAGCEWRLPGCSMCLAMNDDTLNPGERCASTSNRNFEGRQGKGSKTHLVSPAMAAAAAIKGRFADVRDYF